MSGEPALIRVEHLYKEYYTDAGTVPSLLRAAELAAADDAEGRLAPPIVRSVG